MLLLSGNVVDALVIVVLAVSQISAVFIGHVAAVLVLSMVPAVVFAASVTSFCENRALLLRSMQFAFLQYWMSPFPSPKETAVVAPYVPQNCCSQIKKGDGKSAPIFMLLINR